MRIGPWVSRCSFSGAFGVTRPHRTHREPGDNGWPGGHAVSVRPISALRRFYVKAYTDNLTGLAGMVAYNLLLSIFPVALIALFVAGRVLASPELERTVLTDLQELFPSATETTLSQALQQVRDSSTTVGIVAFVTSLWFGASFWGALDTAFCQIYGLPCRSWVRQKLFGFAMLLVPIYILAVQLDLVGTYRGLVIAYSVTSVPFSIWILKGYYDTVPIELEEAARVDGASQLEAFWRILLPLSTPALAIVFLFNFLAACSEYFAASILVGSREDLLTWTLGLQRFQAQFQTQWADLSAASVFDVRQRM